MGRGDAAELSDSLRSVNMSSNMHGEPFGWNEWIMTHSRLQ